VSCDKKPKKWEILASGELLQRGASFAAAIDMETTPQEFTQLAKFAGNLRQKISLGAEGFILGTQT